MVAFLCFEKYFIDAIVQWTNSRVYIASSKHSQIAEFSIVLQTLSGDSAKILPTPRVTAILINDYKIFKIAHGKERFFSFFFWKRNKKIKRNDFFFYKRNKKNNQLKVLYYINSHWSIRMKEFYFDYH